MSFMLNHPTEGVPAARTPVYWDRALRVEENLLQVEAWMGHYNHKLPNHTFIDEAAILVPDYWHRARVTQGLIETGWAMFGEAEDLVYTNPFGTRYCVEYQFWRNPLKLYRLEIMMLVPDKEEIYGFSPLHQALWTPGEPVKGITRKRYPIPHLSFRASTQDVRGHNRAVQHLKDNGCISAMVCQSTYGVFTYLIGNTTQRQIYIKPRVNLRDNQ